MLDMLTISTFSFDVPCTTYEYMDTAVVNIIDEGHGLEKGINRCVPIF
jgi:hypothetical protein